jgi:hypothetical protein
VCFELLDAFVDVTLIALGSQDSDLLTVLQHFRISVALPAPTTAGSPISRLTIAV